MFDWGQSNFGLGLFFCFFVFFQLLQAILGRIKFSRGQLLAVKLLESNKLDLKKGTFTKAKVN